MMVNAGPMANRATLRPGRIVANSEVIRFVFPTLGPLF
jgi:hypothetical protein